MHDTGITTTIIKVKIVTNLKSHLQQLFLNYFTANFISKSWNVILRKSQYFIAKIVQTNLSKYWFNIKRQVKCHLFNTEEHKVEIENLP